MAGTSNNYQLLINKLDQFIRKHYINQFLKGLIYSAAIILGFFLIINLIEYYSYLPVIGRQILFYGFILSSLGIIYWLVFLPILHYYRLGSVISHEQAADIIGKHFSDVQDKLLNILQLKRQSQSMGTQALIEASIDQKIEKLKPVPFSSAINLGDNKKYLRYLILPLLVLFVILFASPNIIRDGTTRLVNNNLHFEKPAPFKFHVNNESLKIIQFEDFDLDVSVEGEYLPENLYVKLGEYSFKMKKNSPTSYSHKFVNLQEDVDFLISAGGYDSRIYEITVLPKPMIINFDVHMDYPGYTGRKDEVIQNIGDITVPIGSEVKWEFTAKNTEQIAIDLGDTTYQADRQGEQLFTFSERIMKSDLYKIKVSNKNLKDADSISYSITVIPDQYPSITVEPLEDTINRNYLYFLGELSDDYGLTQLVFKYKIQSSSGENNKYEVVPVSFNKGSTYSQFNHYLDVSTLNLAPGNKLTYFFEVWDNDRVHGSKSSRSTILQFELPSVDQMELETQETNEEIKEELDVSMKKAEEVKKEMEALQDKMFQKKNLGWEDKKAIEDLLQKQKELQNSVENLKDKFSNNIEKQKQFKNIDEKIMEKQQKLQQLFDEVLSDEMKELFEKMESLLEKMDQEEILENLENFELSEEQLEEELDRMLSLFKQLEFEQKLTETIDKLQELAEKQDELSKETENKSKDNEELAKEQEELNKEFEKVEDELKSLEDINKELGEKNSFSETKEDAEQAKDEMSKSSESLEQNKNKKASQSQQKAADKMQKMSDQLAQMMNSMQMQQMEMDLEAIKQLLENLIVLSFDQENLMEEINNANINDPQYVRLVRRQYRIKDDTELVKDSLFALSKRVFQLESFINKEISEVNKNIEKGISNLEERKKGDANMHQQYVMTGFNNLALMLSETMDAMQQQMASQMPGQQNCQKPGGKGMPKPSLSKLQQDLNDQLSQMKDQMKKGKQPGGKGGMSKAMAEMAAKQAAIRQALKELNKGENADGSLGDLEKLVKEMDKTETELVNKQLAEQMMMRQQEILTRLLETEEALRERELDKERKSKTADEIAKKIPPSLEEYLKQKDAEIQLYKTVPPSMRPYYKQLVENYFKNISF